MNDSGRESRKATGLEPLTQSVLLRHVFFLMLLAWLLTTSAYHGAISPTAGITGVDFRVFYRAGDRLNHGLTLYQAGGDLFVYSPLFALLLRPLAHLPYEKALHVWFFVSAAALLLSILFYAQAARMTLRDAVPLGLMLLLSFRFWPTTMNFGLGQANFILLALVTGMYWADSRNKTVLFALLVVAAALVKVWMLGLLLYLLLKREWKPALLGVSGFAAALVLLFSVVGWREWPLFLQAGAASAKQIAGHRVRQSIIGFADLHFQTNSLMQPLDRSRFLFGLFVLIAASAVGAMLVFVWRSERGQSLPQNLYHDRLKFGLVIASVLLLLPPFEDEYIVFCLPLLWTLLLAPAAGEKQAPPWLLPGGVLIYLVLRRGWPVYPPIPSFYQHGLPTLLASMDYFGVSALWLLASITLWSQRSRDPMKKMTKMKKAGLGINLIGDTPPKETIAGKAAEFTGR